LKIKFVSHKNDEALLVAVALRLEENIALNMGEG
jgi:hypothetical protein